jgi:tetratricopeptide (TPR) repeat protein
MGFISDFLDRAGQKDGKFRELEAQYPGDPEMVNFAKATWLTSRGNYFGQQKDLNRAIADFKEAIRLRPKFVQAHISLGIAYREKGMLKKAVETFQTAPHFEELPGNKMIDHRFQIFNQLGFTYVVCGNKGKALEYLEGSLEIYESLKSSAKESGFSETADRSEFDEHSLDIDYAMVLKTRQLIKIVKSV